MRLWAFRQVFSRPELERQIFEMIDKLDARFKAEGEPDALVITYLVDVTGRGVRVGRCADELPDGESLEPMPGRAAIFLRVSEDKPRGRWLGPLMIRRPGPQSEAPQRELTIRERYPESEWPEAVIYDIQPRLTFPERFPFLIASEFETRHSAAAAGTASSPLAASATASAAGAFLSASASLSGRLVSGLSPPAPVGDTRTLRHESCPAAIQPTPGVTPDLVL